MDLSTLKELLPVPVIVSIITVITLVYFTEYVATIIEIAVENKNGKQIKIFNHKKIWISIFWCIVCTVALAVADFIQWKEVLFYNFVIFGGSSFFYQIFLKKMGVNNKDVPEDSE